MLQSDHRIGIMYVSRTDLLNGSVMLRWQQRSGAPTDVWNLSRLENIGSPILLFTTMDIGNSKISLPGLISNMLERRGSNKSDLACVSLGPNGEYYTSATNGNAWWGGTTDETLAKLNEIRDRITYLDFADHDVFLCRYTWWNRFWNKWYSEKCAE